MAISLAFYLCAWESKPKSSATRRSLGVTVAICSAAIWEALIDILHPANGGMFGFIGGKPRETVES